ncbi:MAG TPA: hypothetical protein VI997_08675 [Candidatus Thermoplasmatota archaeon]|nr:hypothetical protein [Candidatus Thermoplasmatota archaeon]
MIKCPVCGSAIPQVHGASAQVCPRCGAEVDTPDEGQGQAQAQARGRAQGVPRDTAGAAARAVRIVVADYPGWLALYAPFALLALVVEVVGILAVQAAGWSGSVPTDPVRVALVVAVTLPFVVLEYGVGAAFLGVGAAVASRKAQDLRLGAAPRVRAIEGVRILRERAVPLLGAGVVLVAVLFAGLLLLVVPAVFFVHRYLWTTAFVARGRGVGDAFRASHDLAAERRTKAYTAVIVLAWVGVFLVRVTGEIVLGPVLGEGDVWGAVGAAIVAFPLLPVVPALVGSLLAEAEGVAPKAAAPVVVERPTPPAPATARAAPVGTAPPARRATSVPPARRAVRCPGCGTAVPFTPTGAPVRVTCPRCGRTGVVR